MISLCSNYCITNGWFNDLLMGIGFWRGLERVVSAATGMKPREDDFKWTVGYLKENK